MGDYSIMQAYHSLLQSLDHTLFHVSGHHVPSQLTGFEHHQLVQYSTVTVVGKRKSASWYQQFETISSETACTIRHLTISDSQRTPSPPSHLSMEHDDSRNLATLTAIVCCLPQRH